MYSLFILMLFLPACELFEPSSEEILTSQGWKLVMLNELGDIYQTEECEQDDCIFFNSDGSITTEMGSINCDWDESSEAMYSWTLSGNGLTITVDGFAFSLDISKKKMVWSSILGGMTFEPC
jgi:hypothetical protein